LASFTDLAAVIVVCEPKAVLWARIRREARRVGSLGILDVIAFRLYYRLALARADKAWMKAKLQEIIQRYDQIPASSQILEASSPNSPECLRLLQQIQPNFILARCKNILRKQVFQLASHGTFVMHPGICPEYRNAHGCFWALVRRDLDNVGMTFLRVDAGVDTGPVYGYYRCRYDEMRESHAVIQDRVVLDNLDELSTKIREISAGTAQIIDTSGRNSTVWGQPRLTSYLLWKRAASRMAG
jgi:methionyl-tRNA formyltransferase